MSDPPYLTQRDGSSCCGLYAICNALRFFGRTTPEPGSRAWERLVDDIACRHGGALHEVRVADRLGLRLRPIEPEFLEVVANVPAMLTVLMDASRTVIPGLGRRRWLVGNAHAVLVVGGGPREHRGRRRWVVDLVNYTSDRPGPQRVAWTDLPRPQPGYGVRGALAITLKK